MPVNDAVISQEIKKVTGSILNPPNNKGQCNKIYTQAYIKLCSLEESICLRLKVKCTINAAHLRSKYLQLEKNIINPSSQVK